MAINDEHRSDQHSASKMPLFVCSCCDRLPDDGALVDGGALGADQEGGGGGGGGGGGSSDISSRRLRLPQVAEKSSVYYDAHGTSITGTSSVLIPAVHAEESIYYDAASQIRPPGDGMLRLSHGASINDRASVLLPTLGQDGQGGGSNLGRGASNRKLAPVPDDAVEGVGDESGGGSSVKQVPNQSSPPSSKSRPAAKSTGRSTRSNRSHSSTRSSILRSVGQTLLLKKRLREPPHLAPSIDHLDPPTGYPGYLTESQLESCLEFRKRLQSGISTDDSYAVYRDMVSCFSSVEGESYSLCRYLRARKFDVGATIAMMEERSSTWKDGAEHQFYPDASQAIGGAPESALLTQFPLVLGSGGTARNGCPVAYFTTKRVSIDGIECVTTMDRISNYIWHFAVHKLRDHIAKVLEENPDQFVRVQLVVVFDLKGLRLDTLRRALGALEGALKVLGVFPEMLSTVVVLSVPRFFAAFWPVVKAFMDPDTAKKIELYSSPKAGQRRTLELIDTKDLASDHGGSAPSVDLEVARQGRVGTDSQPSDVVDRQFFELLTVHNNKRGKASCDFLLEDGEEATSVTVYTKAHDGAIVNLYKGEEQAPVKTVVLSRSSEQVDAGTNFFKTIASSLRGPAKYRITISKEKHPGTEAVEYFLVLADYI